jgi:hypothetical protein
MRQGRCPIRLRNRCCRKHPDYYAHVVAVLEDTRRTRTAFSTRHRMIDKQGRHHRVAVVYGLDADAAFEILKWRSQQSNVKLRTVAERLVSTFRAMSTPVLPERSVYDHALLTLHAP